MLDVIEAVSDPGNPARPNEDRAGSNAACAFVIDGATGLGDRQLMPEFGSDAAWLAKEAKKTFETTIGEATDLAMVLSDFSIRAKSAFESAANGAPVPRYAWPSASFGMVHRANGSWEFAGLGDCTLYVRHGEGKVRRFSALPDFRAFEQDGARRYIARSGGFGRMASFRNQPETLQALRAARAAQNTQESGIWTLGLVSEAGRHVVRLPLPAAPAPCLLCTDGFADLVDLYRHYTPETLIDTALDQGLSPLIAELRQIEREIDPDGLAFARFKQSDDATAVLFRIV